VGIAFIAVAIVLFLFALSLFSLFIRLLLGVSYGSDLIHYACLELSRLLTVEDGVSLIGLAIFFSYLRLSVISA
jgi:hypothetical protein